MRGLTVAFMIIVNTPGDWNHVWPFLRHAEWNGCRPADLVFPFFLFLVGCVIPFSLDGRLAAGESRPLLARHILSRALALFGLKLCLSAWPHFHLTHLRLFGVLTRIALCYAAVALLYMVTRSRNALLTLTGFILVLYWILLRFVPVPGLGIPGRDFPFLDPNANLAAWIDRGISAWTLRHLHTGVLLEKTWDPEGLLSTLPSCATVLLGVLAGKRFRDRGLAPAARPRFLAVEGIACLGAGLIWSLAFPVNKSLWTSSYVLVTAGLAVLLLAAFDALFDLRRAQETSRPAARALAFMRVFGINAIAAFLLSGFAVKTLMALPAPGGRSLYAWLGAAFAHLPIPAEAASFLFSVAALAAIFLPLAALCRRNIILKL